jgi:hypothetical protein
MGSTTHFRPKKYGAALFNKGASVFAPRTRLRSKRSLDEESLLVEWPTEEKKPPKFWLATVLKNVALDRLVELTKLRWRIDTRN